MTYRPREHWAVWHGRVPHLANGQPRTTLLALAPMPDGSGVVAPPFKDSMILSSMLPNGYVDHEDKLLSYIAPIQAPARQLQPHVCAWRDQQ